MWKFKKHEQVCMIIPVYFETIYRRHLNVVMTQSRVKPWKTEPPASQLASLHSGLLHLNSYGVPTSL